MKKLLSADTAHLRDLLESLTVHHSLARSLDCLGTALKVVAGTPDAETQKKSGLQKWNLYPKKKFVTPT